MRFRPSIMVGLLLAAMPLAARAQSADYTACTLDGEVPPVAERFDVCDRVVKRELLEGLELAKALRVRGHALRFAGRFYEALRDYERAIPLQTDHPGGYLGRAEIRSARGDHQGAFADANVVVRLSADWPPAYLLRGQASIQLGMWPQADADLTRGLELSKTTPGSEAEMLLLRGFGRVHYGRPKDAVPDLDEAIRLKPGVAFAHRARGMAWGALQSYERAAADFTQALALQDSPDDRFNRGMALAYLSLPDRALAEFDTALRLAPRDWPLLQSAEGEVRAYREAVAAERQRDKNRRLGGFAGPFAIWRVAGEPNRFFGFPGQPQATMDRAEPEPPGRPAAVPWLALMIDPPALPVADSRILRAREQMQAGDTTAAMDALDAAIASGATADLLVARADVWQRRSAVSAALRDLDRAVDLQPNRADLHVRRGVAALRAGQTHFGVTNIETALRRAPADATAQLNLAVARILSGETRKARIDLDSLVKAGAMPADTFRLRGALRAQMDDIPGALADLTQSLSLQPSDSRSLLLRGRTLALSGNTAAALADFARIDPAEADSLDLGWTIGLVQFAAGQYAPAAARFVALASANHVDAHARILAYVAARRSGLVDRLVPDAPEYGAHFWPRPVRFLLGGYGSVDEVKDAARQSDRTMRAGRVCEAAFYVAAWSSLAKPAAETRRHWDAARKDCPADDLFQAIALAEGQRLRP